MVALDLAESEDPLRLFAPEPAAFATDPLPSAAPAPSGKLAPVNEIIPARSMSVTRVSLVDLFASEMPLRWSEVVAIAQGVCQAMLKTSDTAKAVPPLWHVVITSLGTVEISAGIAADGPPTSLVRQILEVGPADDKPVWIRLCLFSLKPLLRIATVRDLVTVLELFESSGRSDLIGGVVARYLGWRPAPASPGALVERTKTAPVERSSPFGMGPWPGLTTATALVAIVGTLGFDVWWLIKATASIGRTTAEMPLVAASAAGNSTPVINPQALMRRLGLVSGTLVSRAPTAGYEHYIFDASGIRREKAFGDRRRLRTPDVRRNVASAPSSRSGPQVMAVTAPSAMPEANVIHDVEAHDVDRMVAPPRTEWSEVEAVVVYDNRDTDVTPPIELTQSSKMARWNPSAATTRFELVIDEAGVVVSAQLLEPGRQWDEMMLLSAMKTRRFRPATRNNQPVKYRTRILVAGSQDQ